MALQSSTQPLAARRKQHDNAHKRTSTFVRSTREQAMSSAKANSAAMPADIIVRSQEDGVLTLTLNRPAQRNALSEALIAALTDTLLEIETDRSVRAVILDANGPVFCAGHDLREMSAHRQDADGGRAYFEDILSRCSRMMQAIVRLPQPVIAAVEGVATAAGCQLVASCDLAIAGAKAGFCTPGVHIGLFCSTPMVALSRNLSRKHAMEMLLLGETIDAETAARMGLVNRVCPAGEAKASADGMAQVIAAKSQAALRVGKRAFYEQAEMPLTEAYVHAARAMAENMLFRDAEEGIGAFLEKRAPRWHDA